MPAKPDKGQPIPVRFDAREEAALEQIVAKSRLSRSEIIRRAVRLFAGEWKQRGEKVGWILDELGDDAPAAGPPPGAAGPNANAAALIEEAAEATARVAEEGSPQSPPDRSRGRPRKRGGQGGAR